MCTINPLTRHKGECCRISVSSSKGYDDRDKDIDKYIRDRLEPIYLVVIYLYLNPI